MVSLYTSIMYRGECTITCFQLVYKLSSTITCFQLDYKLSSSFVSWVRNVMIIIGTTKFENSNSWWHVWQPRKCSSGIYILLFFLTQAWMGIAFLILVIVAGPTEIDCS